MAGLYLEQFEIGSVFEHEIRRTVTESNNVWFCGATCNPARQALMLRKPAA
jgi:acyl dehydratase